MKSLLFLFITVLHSIDSEEHESMLATNDTEVFFNKKHEKSTKKPITTNSWMKTFNQFFDRFFCRTAYENYEYITIPFSDDTVLVNGDNMCILESDDFRLHKYATSTLPKKVKINRNYKGSRTKNTI